VISYALAHPKEGYRRLAWMMTDADVVYLSPASVYRVLNDADLLYRWKRSCRGGERPAPPSAPNQRWHTDSMYLRVADVWYVMPEAIVSGARARGRCNRRRRRGSPAGRRHPTCSIPPRPGAGPTT
jgi:hypothetical protein